MNVLKVVLILTILKIIESKLVDNLLLLTHSSGPSHLSVGFDLAERFNDSENVYDIRFPMLESVWNFKTRKNFKHYNFDFTMKKADEVKKYLDEFTTKKSVNISTILKIVRDGMETLIVPCKLTDKIFDFAGKRNLALMDMFSSGCHAVISRRHEARIAYFAPGVEPSTIAGLSGAPLPGYAMSFIKGDPRLNFHVRLINFFAHGLFKFVFLQLPLAKWWYDGDDKNYKNLEESIVAVNSHKFVDFPLPRTHLIVEMGNLAEKEIKPFDTKVQKFIDSHESIIYFSMSTFTSDGQLPAEIIKEFTTTFKKFPKVGVIWRLKENLVDSPPNNILFIDWIDQRSLLAHPKVKLFITHCGMNSVLEAVHAGVPMIGMPTMGDQFSNSEAIKKLKMGIVLNLYSFTNVQLSDAISQILNPGSIESRSANKVKDMLSFERQHNITLDGSFTLKRFMRMSQENFEKFWIPKNTNWISHFYLDWALVLVLVNIFCF